MQTHPAGGPGTDPTSTRPTPPGWYPDPWRLAPQRWWDGFQWTGSVAGPPAWMAPKPALAQARAGLRGGGVAILGFAGALALALVAQRVMVAAGCAPGTLPVLLAGQAGLWGGLSMAAYIVTHRRPGGSFGDLGLYRPTAGEVGIGIGAGIGGLFVAARVAMVLRAIFPDDSAGVRTSLFAAPRPSVATLVVIGVIACVGAPFFEEIFFRGVVQGVLHTHLGPALAIVMQAILFGAAHFQLGMTFNQAMVRCGTVAVLGLVLGFLRHHSGRLGAGMAAHATNNFVVVCVTALYLATR